MSDEKKPPTGEPGDEQQKKPPATKPATDIERARTIGALIERRRVEFQRVIPKHLNPDRLMRVALSAISRNRRLLSCDEGTLLRGVMQASILGLEIDVNGEAYLVPFYNSKRGVYEATMIPGYKGLMKLMRQSREVESIHASVAREADLFDFDVGDRAFVKHRPALTPRNEDESVAIAYYCAVRTKGAQFPQVTVLSPSEVDRHRQRSRAKDEGPWVTDYEPMGIKTAIRVASKTAPASANLSRALALEERVEGGGGAAARDLFPETNGLEDVLDVEAKEAGWLDEDKKKPSTTASEVEQAMKGKPTTSKPTKPERDPGEEG